MSRGHAACHESVKVSRLVTIKVSGWWWPDPDPGTLTPPRWMAPLACTGPVAIAWCLLQHGTHLTYLGEIIWFMMNEGTESYLMMKVYTESSSFMQVVWSHSPSFMNVSIFYYLETSWSGGTSSAPLPRGRGQWRHIWSCRRCPWPGVSWAHSPGSGRSAPPWSRPRPRWCWHTS